MDYLFAPGIVVQNGIVCMGLETISGNLCLKVTEYQFHVSLAASVFDYLLLKISGKLFHSVIIFPVLTLLQLTCGICFDTFSRENIKSTACGHPFCSECWRGIVVFTRFVTQ